MDLKILVSVVAISNKLVLGTLTILLPRKKIVMNAIKDKKSFPRQKLTFLADDHNISFEKAKQIFVIDKL